MKSSRKLIHFPIIHTAEEMGIDSSLYDANCSQMWEGIQDYFEKTPFDFSKMKVYQDSWTLPNIQISDYALSISNSPNLAVLAYLQRKGARIMQTEDEEALKRFDLMFEYKYQENSDTAMVAFSYRLQDSLTDNRDLIIARVIDWTLFEGEVGVALLGYRHNISRYLDRSITIFRPVLDGVDEARREILERHRFLP